MRSRMEFENGQLLERLRLEILVHAGGGYRSVKHAPYRQPRFFRDSVGCLNFALEEKEESCRNCPLIAFVPPEHRDKEVPCSHIPLNAVGDTIASLEASGQRDKLGELLLAWLRSMLARLEGE
jgi:hypothetical protein